MVLRSPSLDVWLWKAQALGPREVIMLTSDGLEWMRPVALMPQPATREVMSPHRQVWATRPIHRVGSSLHATPDVFSIEGNDRTSLRSSSMNEPSNLYPLIVKQYVRPHNHRPSHSDAGAISAGADLRLGRLSRQDVG